MGSYIALLRAVNVGGTSPLSMAALRVLLERLGLEDARTLLQSGNAAFRCRGRSPPDLEARIERELSDRLGVKTDVFVRSVEEWRAVVDGNPFSKEGEQDPGHLVVTALKASPSDGSWRALRAAVQGRERVHGVGRQAYIVYPDGQGRSKLSIAVIERTLGTRGTSRNWNTVQKLNRLAAE